MKRLLLFYLALLALGLALSHVGFRISETLNHDSQTSDQGAYMGMAEKLRGSLLPDHTDGTRNPLFPWLVAKFLDPKSPEFFEAGKRFNVLLATLGSLLVGIFNRRRLGALAAWNLAALAGLGCLIPIGIFFGAEVLFYLFFFGLWRGAFAILKRPTPGLAILTGLCAGLAYLAKPSTGPFLMGFALLIFLLCALWPFRRTIPAFSEFWNPRAALVALGCLLAAAFLVMTPRLLMAKRTYGSAFYSLPSFWFWADDWDTCFEKYGNCTPYGLSRIPPEEWPTAANYFRRHSVREALERLTSGTVIKLQQLLVPQKKFPWKKERRNRPRRMTLPMRGFYLMLCGMVALTFLAAAKFRPLLASGAMTPAVFGLGVFCVYTMAYGWYHVIGPGPRFVMMFYIPLLWSFFAAARSSALLTRWGPWGLGAFHGLLALALASRLLALLADSNFLKMDYAF